MCCLTKKFIPYMSRLMKNLTKATTILLTVFFIGNTGAGYAQDSTKKAKPPVVKPVAKPVAKYNPYAVKQKYPVKATTQPASQQAAAPGAVVARPYQQVAPENTALMNDKSLNGQYQYLLTRVYNYQRPLISALWKNYSDTLNVTRRKLKETSAQLAAQTHKADTLQAEVTAKEQNLSVSNSRVDQVSLLGMPLTKATYNWIMWGLVVAFGVIAALVVARSGSHSREAKYRTKLYSELEEEYKTYKVKANEKEKKLARELQTERNKLEELRGNA